MDINKIIVGVLIIIFCIGCDQSTKTFAQRNLPKGTTFSYLGDSFRLYYTENKGAFLSLGSNWSETARFWLLTVMPMVALIAIGFTLVWSKKDDWLTLLAFALILGGGFSNMWDRISNEGYVVDFMNMGIGSLRTGIFNFADVFITTAFFLIVFDNIREHFLKKKAAGGAD